MKKFILSVATVALLVAAVPTQANTKTPAPTAVVTPEVAALITRLYEIKEMDISSLNRAEKTALRGEVRVIKSELKRLDSSVTMSLGALIIIILLLVLLL